MRTPARMIENQHVEWKETWRDQFLKWICGFANAKGGALHIGRNDKTGIEDNRIAREWLGERLGERLGEKLGETAAQETTQERSLADLRMRPRAIRNTPSAQWKRARTTVSSVSGWTKSSAMWTIRRENAMELT